MSAITICLSFTVCFMLLMSMECAVIKMQEIPLNKDVVMKIIIKEDNDGDSATTIKISLDHKKKIDKQPLPIPHGPFVLPASDFVPDLNDRSAIVTGNCPLGKVRRGLLCT